MKRLHRAGGSAALSQRSRRQGQAAGAGSGSELRQIARGERAAELDRVTGRSQRRARVVTHSDVADAQLGIQRLLDQASLVLHGKAGRTLALFGDPEADGAAAGVGLEQRDVFACQRALEVDQVVDAAVAGVFGFVGDADVTDADDGFQSGLDSAGMVSRVGRVAHLCGGSGLPIQAHQTEPELARSTADALEGDDLPLIAGAGGRQYGNCRCGLTLCSEREALAAATRAGKAQLLDLVDAALHRLCGFDQAPLGLVDRIGRLLQPQTCAAAVAGQRQRFAGQRANEFNAKTRDAAACNDDVARANGSEARQRILQSRGENGVADRARGATLAIDRRGGVGLPAHHKRIQAFARDLAGGIGYRELQGRVAGAATGHRLGAEAGAAGSGAALLEQRHRGTGRFLDKGELAGQIAEAGDTQRDGTGEFQ